MLALRLQKLWAKQIGDLFAAPDQARPGFPDHNFRRTSSRVVVRRDRHPVSARVEDSYQIALRYWLEFATTRKEVSGLAYRTNHIGGNRCAPGKFDRDNLVKGIVERRPDEVVHRGVNNEKL